MLVDVMLFILLTVLIFCACIYYRLGFVKEDKELYIEKKKPLTDYEMNCKLAKSLHHQGKDKEYIENSVIILNDLRINLRDEVSQDVLIDWVSYMGEIEIARYMSDDVAKKETLILIRTAFS